MSVENEIQMMSSNLQSNMGYMTQELKNIVTAMHRLEIRLMMGRHFQTENSGVVKVMGPTWDGGHVNCIGKNGEELSLPVTSILHEVPEIKGALHTGKKNGV